MIPGTLKSVVAALGPMPGCIGHYSPGDKQCDGAPCAWRAPCQTYREQALKLAVSYGMPVDAYLEGQAGTLSKHVLAEHVIQIHRRRPADPAPIDPEYLQAWQRFKAAMESMDLGVPVYPKRRMAKQKEVYIQTNMRELRGRRYAAQHTVKVKFPVPDEDVGLFKYHCGTPSRAAPMVEYRAPVRTVLAQSEYIYTAARRWVGIRNKRGRRHRHLGTKAVGVYPERVEDLGRLAAHLLKNGLLPGIGVVDGKVVVAEEAYEWRRATRW